MTFIKGHKINLGRIHPKGRIPWNKGVIKYEDTLSRKEYKAEWYRKNKDKSRKATNKWREANPEKVKESNRKSNIKHRIKRNEKAKQCHKKNKEKYDKSNKKWREQNPEKVKEYRRKSRKYRKTLKGKLCMYNYNAKRKRNLGYVILNIRFEGSHGHNINKVDVIFIPEEIHKSISHNVYTNHNMNVINTIAFFFLVQNNIYNIMSFFNHKQSKDILV